MISAIELIQPTITKIDTIAKEEQPKLLSQLVREIFDSKGTTHGRAWEDNTPSTAKRKGKNHRNVDTGLLEDTLSQEGFIEEDDYMDRLPQIDSDHNYKYANYGNNKFDDIGRTNDDKAWLKEQLIKAIKEQLSG